MGTNAEDGFKLLNAQNAAKEATKDATSEATGTPEATSTATESEMCIRDRENSLPLSAQLFIRIIV